MSRKGGENQEHLSDRFEFEKGQEPKYMHGRTREPGAEGCKNSEEEGPESLFVLEMYKVF